METVAGKAQKPWILRQIKFWEGGQAFSVSQIRNIQQSLSIREVHVQFDILLVSQTQLTIVCFQFKHECLDDLIIYVTIKHNEDPSKSCGGKKRLTCSGVTLLVNYLSISIKIQLHVWEVMGLRLPCLTAGPFGCSKYSNIIRNVCFDWIRTWYADIWTCRDGNQRVMCCNDLPNDDYSNTHNILQNLGTPTDVWLKIQTPRRLWTIKLRKGPRPHHQPNIYTDWFRFNWKLEKIRLVTNVTNVTNVCLLGSWQTDNCHDIYCRQQNVPQLTPNVVTLPSNSHGFKPAVKVSHQNF